jgi:hypothetical protein
MPCPPNRLLARPKHDSARALNWPKPVICRPRVGLNHTAIYHRPNFQNDVGPALRGSNLAGRQSTRNCPSLTGLGGVGGPSYFFYCLRSAHPTRHNPRRVGVVGVEEKDSPPKHSAPDPTNSDSMSNRFTRFQLGHAPILDPISPR